MSAIILKWIIVLLCTMNAGYMLFDGSRALVTGDYIRPKTGEYAGQLGPWAILVEKIGIAPMSLLMKLIFVVYGIIGLVFVIAFIMDAQWSWKALLFFNICALWYLVFGTFSSIIQIILLFVYKSMK